MNNRDLANELLAALGRTLTVEGLRLGAEDNSCVLLFDANLTLNIEYDEPGERLVFSIYLDTLPTGPCEPLLRELLAANLYWIGAAGATLCLESPNGAILLVYASRLTELGEDRLERTVDNLLTTAEKWRERIAAHRNGTVASAGQPSNPSPKPDDSRVYG
ncbi:MAG: type III secretion system chaperone [Gammaproteobacteria bacterium]